MTEHKNDRHHFYSFITMNCKYCDGNVEFEFSDTSGETSGSCEECHREFRLSMALDIKKFEEAGEYEQQGESHHASLRDYD